MFGYGYDRITGEKFASRSEVLGQNGMIATSHPLATQIGLDILKKGGTAIDAAIAANIALGLMEPTGSGVGGDLFAIVWHGKENKLYGLNASGPSPKSINLNFFKAALEMYKCPLCGGSKVPPKIPILVIFFLTNFIKKLFPYLPFTLQNVLVCSKLIKSYRSTRMNFFC